MFRKSAEDINELSVDLLNKGKINVETYASKDIAYTKAKQAIDLMQRESLCASVTIDIQRQPN